MRLTMILITVPLMLLTGAAIAGKDEESFGHMGNTKGEGSRIACAGWQQGDQAVLVGFSKVPGQPYSPAYVVAFHLANTKPESILSSTGGSANEIFARQAYVAAGNKAFWINYHIVGKPASEQLTVGGQPAAVALPMWAKMIGEKPIALAEGRVLLVDLTVQPPTVRQAKVDLAEVFPSVREGASLEKNKDEFRAALDRLKSQSAPVKQFLKAK